MNVEPFVPNSQTLEPTVNVKANKLAHNARYPAFVQFHQRLRRASDGHDAICKIERCCELKKFPEKFANSLEHYTVA